MGHRITVLTCDELLISLNGKFSAGGIYTSDIGIPAKEHAILQLAFLFIIEADATEPFQALRLEVTLPGEPPHSQVFPLPQVLPGRDPIVVKWPLLVLRPTLRPGPIQAKVIHDKGEIVAAPQWITLLPQGTGQTGTTH